MANFRTLDRSFAAGEITPELYGRIDLAKFQTGLATARNFITLPHGPAMSRPGTEFVREVQNSANITRLIPFSYNNTQTFAIEVGAGYFRFHTNAQSLLVGSVTAWNAGTAYAVGDLASSGGVNYYCILAHTNNVPPNATYWYPEPANGVYEVPSPYAAADVMDIHFTQSNDVITLVHPSYAVRELRRVGATNWQLTAPSFVPAQNAPTGVAAVATTGTGSTIYNYVVTTVNPGTFEESVASTPSPNCSNDLTTSPNKNTISWNAVSGAVRYRIYKNINGLYGYIGQAGGTSFVDQNITPDVSVTPPISDSGFNDATGNYPATVAYYEQRRCFAGTNNAKSNVWGTRTGTESNLSYTIPTQDDNRLSFKIAAREANAVRHLVPVANLLALTASCEFRIAAADNGALSPAGISVKPQSYIGTNNVTPVVVGNSVLFAQARGGHIREMAYNWQANGYVPNDISIMAPHLFDYYSIVDMCYSRAPYPILWAVRNDGVLLGMTYVPEQQVAGWHHHDTINGTFESICCITENNEDMLYATVKRTIGGQTKRYIERLHTRFFNTLADAFFVDCGATYSGAPTTTVSGLTWLEGQTVNILADGAVCPQQTVTGGQVSIPVAASKITVGLPITADMQTLPLTTQLDPGYGQGRPKNVNRVWIRVDRSGGVFAGPSFTKLVPYKQRTTEPFGSPPNLITDEIEIALNPSWGYPGGVCLRQTDPLPLIITSMTIDAVAGG